MVQFLSTNFFATSIGFIDKQNGGNGGSEKAARKSSAKSFGLNQSANSSMEKMPAEFLQSKIKNFFKLNIIILTEFFDKIASRTQSGSKRNGERTSNIQPIPLPPISLPIVLCQLYRNALFAFNNSRIDILSSEFLTELFNKKLNYLRFIPRRLPNSD